MEQGRMMDAGVNPVVVDYDANSLSLFMERCFRFERFRSWNFTGRKLKQLDNFFNREL